MRSLTLIKVCSLALTLTAISSSVFAQEKVIFQPVEQETEQARAMCYGKRDRSQSETTKQSHRFRGYLDPHQLEGILSERQGIELDRIISASHLIVMGEQSIAEVQEVEIVIEIKSLNEKMLSMILFRWSPRDPERMERLAEYQENLSFVDKGLPECLIEGPRFADDLCIFDVEDEAGELLDKHLGRLGDERREIDQKSVSQGVIIDVLYRSQAYVDCSGRNTQSIVRARSTRPILSLKKR